MWSYTGHKMFTQSILKIQLDTEHYPKTQLQPSAQSAPPVHYTGQVGFLLNVEDTKVLLVPWVKLFDVLGKLFWYFWPGGAARCTQEMVKCGSESWSEGLGFVRSLLNTDNVTSAPSYKEVNCAKSRHLVGIPKVQFPLLHYSIPGFRLSAKGRIPDVQSMFTTSDFILQGSYLDLCSNFSGEGIRVCLFVFSCNFFCIAYLLQNANC